MNDCVHAIIFCLVHCGSLICTIPSFGSPCSVIRPNTFLFCPLRMTHMLDVSDGLPVVRCCTGAETSLTAFLALASGAVWKVKLSWLVSDARGLVREGHPGVRICSSRG